MFSKIVDELQSVDLMFQIFMYIKSMYVIYSSQQSYIKNNVTMYIGFNNYWFYSLKIMIYLYIERLSSNCFPEIKGWN